MASRLPEVKCPVCGKVMAESDKPICQTKKYEDCIRKCTECKVGASNSRTHPTIIFKDYHDAIPKDYHQNLDFTLDNGLNQVNRENKHTMFGFSSSEDALSWIFIRHFIEKSRLDLLKDILFLKEDVEQILLWGVPQIQPSKDSLDNLKGCICSICDRLGEMPTGYSEPDIIVMTKSEVSFIEVKLGAENANAKRPEDFDKYLIDRFYSYPDKAKKSGRYELARNWTIGNLFSENKSFTLVNLAPRSLFNRDQQLLLFESSLNNKTGVFKKVAWEDVLEKLSDEKGECVAELKKRLRMK